jgi:hypothetical protein
LAAGTTLSARFTSLLTAGVVGLFLFIARGAIMRALDSSSPAAVMVAACTGAGIAAATTLVA